jgi:hypothetical protein
VHSLASSQSKPVGTQIASAMPFGGSNSDKPGFFFGRRSSSSSRDDSPSRKSSTSSSVLRRHRSATSADNHSHSFFGRRTEERSILAARQKVADAESAEIQADKALQSARAAVKEARGHVKILEQEAAEEYVSFLHYIYIASVNGLIFLALARDAPKRNRPRRRI